MLNFFYKSKTILLILLLAFTLRFWNLENIPPHLRNDEAALGYNAYSILKTNRDEHGQLFPLVFQSFGDWKMGGYIYLTVPFVAIFGLNQLVVRLPSALFGTISVWLIFKIVEQLFNKKRLAFISSFVFAISPINVVFSRGAWEVNVSLTLTLAAILFFLKAIHDSRVLLILSAFFFGLTLLTSHTAKLSTPFLMLILFFSYFNYLKKFSIKLILLSVFIGLIFVTPVALSVFEGKITRLTTLNIFSYQSGFPLLQSIASRWFSIYSASTLFLKGDANPQHTAPNTGPFLVLDGILMIFGIITLIKKGTTIQKFFVFSGVLLLSLPSALTIENINLERILPVSIPITVMISTGISKLFETSQKRFTNILLLIFVLLYLLNYIYFLDQYFIHGPKKNDAWQYGYKQIFEKINTSKSEVIVQQSLEQPYIFLLFYQKYDPKRYQNIVSEVFIPNKEGKDMGLVSRIDNIKFLDINWSKTKPKPNTIFVMPIFKLNQQSKFYSNYNVIEEITDLNGFSLFKIIEII